MKVLIVKLSAIGDVIHALPAAAYLKRAVPGIHIAWAVEQGAAQLVTDNPAIDEPIIFNAKRWAKQLSSPGSWLRNLGEANSFFAHVRSAKYDAVLELQGLLKSSALAKSTGSSVVAGFAETREFADKFLSHKVDVGDYFGHHVPVVELNLKVCQSTLQKLGMSPPDIHPVEFPLPRISQAAEDKIEALLQGKGAPSEPPEKAPPGAPAPVSNPIPDGSTKNPIYIVLIPGTTWVTKIWPESKWVELAALLSKSFDCRIVLVGSKSETEMNGTIARKIQETCPGQVVLDLTNKTSLLELIPLFRKSAMVIGADTGPLHLAAAVQIPQVIGVFGSTPWRRNGPYGEQCHTVSLSLDCQPCYSKTCKLGTVECLTTLSPDTVFEACRARL